MTVIKKYSMFGNCTAENANQYYFLLINLIDSAVQMATWFRPKTKKFNPPVTSKSS